MVDCMPHSWPKSFNIGRMQIVPIHAASFHKRRKFTRARHMWLRLEPNWRLLRSHMYTEWPGIHTYAEINDRLFVNPGRNENIQDTKSKVRRYSPEYWQWMGQIEYMWQFLDGQVLPVQIEMEDTLAEYHANLRKEQAEGCAAQACSKEAMEDQGWHFPSEAETTCAEESKERSNGWNQFRAGGSHFF